MALIITIFMNTVQKKCNPTRNLALGGRVSINVRYFLLSDILVIQSEKSDERLIYREFHLGDISHSQSDVTKAQHLLGHHPMYRLGSCIAQAAGLRTVNWSR